MWRETVGPHLTQDGKCLGKLHMSNCDCNTYTDVEMDRAAVSRRIKESKNLKKRLVELAIHSGKEYLLLKCEECGQFWQASRAWNWGNDLYVFKVPSIATENWLQTPYVSPDDLLIFGAMMSDYLRKNKFEKKNEKCQDENCSELAVQYSVLCLRHH